MLKLSSKVIAVLSAVWAVGISVYIFFSPVTGDRVEGALTPDGIEALASATTQQSWYEAQGAWGILVLALISVFYLFSVRVALRENHTGLLFAAVAAALISIVTGFSVGIAYLPAAAGLLLAALLLLTAYWLRSTERDKAIRRNATDG